VRGAASRRTTDEIGISLKEKTEAKKEHQNVPSRSKGWADFLRKREIGVLEEQSLREDRWGIQGRRQ